MNPLLSNYTLRIKRILMISLFTTLMSQISLDFYNGQFYSSFGPICIPLFMYLLDKVDVISTTVVSSAFIFASRLLIHLAQNGDLVGVVNQYGPEVLFYFTEGLLWFVFDQIISHRRKLYIYIPGIMFIDFICNKLELFTRIQIGEEIVGNQNLLIFIALVRGLILLILLISLDKYRIMLFSKTHAQRYQRLIMLISRLSGEIVWMEKNVDQIENTMSTSYKLYDSLLAEGDDERAKDALSVAKDIHEIKKDYRLICRGLSETINEETEDGMEMSEIFTLLIQAVQREISDSGKRMLVGLNLDDHLYTKDPYLYLSVFRNLMSNAIEAMETDACSIQITEQRVEDDYVFIFTDNGPGISKEYTKHVFQPRFSTKVDYDTGVVNRGLGLPIVKGIVEENLGGKVVLKPSAHGTKFVITIPKERLEVIS